MKKSPTAVIIMGVSGCGKSSVGNELSVVTGWPFFDGDEYHPQANVEKMALGIPLNDKDRRPWLEELHHLIDEHLFEGKSLIVASSALKRSYRKILRGKHSEEVVFVHLKGDFDLIYGRMQQREDHYMKAEMLHSQLGTLQDPQHALVIDIEKSISEITQEILTTLQLQRNIE